MSSSNSGPASRPGAGPRAWVRLAAGLSAPAGVPPCLTLCSFFFLILSLFFRNDSYSRNRLGCIREISDLQEIIEWKDRKIGVGPPSLWHLCGGVLPSKLSASDSLVSQKGLFEFACYPQRDYQNE